MNLNRCSRLRGYRQPDHKYYHRDRHGFGHSSKSSESNRGSRDHHRCSHVRRPEELTLLPVGKAEQGRGSGENSPGASFPIWRTI